MGDDLSPSFSSLFPGRTSFSVTTFPMCIRVHVRASVSPWNTMCLKQKLRLLLTDVPVSGPVYLARSDHYVAGS